MGRPRKHPIEKNGVACNPNPRGLCMCGCGERTNLSPCTRGGRVRGKPQRYVFGHSNRSSKGYHAVKYGDGTQYKHIIIAERIFGGPLPEGAQIHHANKDKRDNRPGNLVICEDDAYHKLLHRRQRALATCGNPNWVVCGYCSAYDSPENMKTPGPGEHRSAYHRECATSYNRYRETDPGEGSMRRWREWRFGQREPLSG